MENKYKIPKTHKCKLYITLGIGRFNEGRINVQEYQPSKKSDGFEALLLKEVDFSVYLKDCDISNEAVIGAYVDALKTQKEAIQSEAHVRIKDIDDKIQNLLAIEYKPENED